MFWNLKRVLAVAGALVILAAAGWFLGRPMYRGWRERHSLEQAREFFAKADLRNAMLAARRTLVFNNANVEACRLMANCTELLRSPQALTWRQKVVDLQPQNFTNQIQLARTAILQGQHARAAEALEAIPPLQQDHPACHQLTAMIALAKNDVDEASRELAEAVRLNPDDKQTRLNLAVLNLQSTNQARVAGAFESLRELHTDPEFRGAALRQMALAAIKSKDWTNAAGFTRDLQAMTNAPLDDRLLHLRALKGIGPAEFAGYLRPLQDMCKSSAVAASGLASWLLAQDEAAEAARWLASLPDELQARQEVQMARADACAALKDWGGLQKLLNQCEWGTSEFLRHGMLARAAREQRDPQMAQAEWRLAGRAASGNARHLAMLARMAITWSWPRERDEVLWMIVQRFPAERWAVQALNESYLKSGDTLGLRKLNSELLARNPDDAGAMNNFAALSLLLNLETDRAHELARGAYLRRTNNAAFASTYAWSLHLLGRSAEGLAILESLTPAQLEQSTVALYYGALQTTNAPEKARKLLDLAETGPLLPEEKVLLQTARKQL